MTTDNYMINILDLNFENLTFSQGGNLFNFRHLLPSPVVIANSTFLNLVGASIYSKSYTTNIPGLYTMLVLSNITVDNLDMMYGSFITLETGSILTIVDSTFSNVA